MSQRSVGKEEAVGKGQSAAGLEKEPGLRKPTGQAGALWLWVPAPPGPEQAQVREVLRMKQRLQGRN